MNAPNVGYLYTGAGHPISDTPLPPLDGPGGLIHSRPVCSILCKLEEEADLGGPVGADLIYVLPLGARPHLIEPLDLAEMVGCLDRDGRIALHGTHQEAITAAIETLLALTGGGHA